jgi:hypothetical protein
MGDLYPRWVGARELLLHKRNPYGPEVSQQIQIAFYGHAIIQDYSSPGHKTVDEQRFAYPVYVVFLMAPTVYTDFATVHRAAPSALALLTGIGVLLSISLLRWRIPWEQKAAITLLTISSPQIVQGLEHQQLAIVVGLLLIAGMWCAARNYLAVAGIFLAWSTIKPQMALLPLCFFLVWVIGDWVRRWRLFAGFLAMLFLLIGAGELILPGWVGNFQAAAADYRKYFPTTSFLRMAVGDALGEVLGGIVVVGLIVLAWRNRREAADSRKCIATFATFLMGTILAFPLFTPFNQVMLILPTMLLLHDWKTLPKFSRVVFVVTVTWPWITSLVLLLSPPRLNSPNQLPLLPAFLTPFFPLFLPLLLMTRREDATLPQLGAADLRLS